MATNAQSAVLNITEAMLHAAPGKQLLDALAAPGATTASMAALVVTTDLWQNDMGYGSLSASQTYTKFVKDLVGNTVTTANQASVVDLMNSIFGTNVASAIAAFTDLIADPALQTDANWGTAAKMFQNKVAVSSYYSIDKGMATTSLGALQQVTAGVTDNPSSVISAKSSMDFAGFSTTTNLTALQDNLVGSSLNDTFVAHIFDNQNTLQSGDKINGGGGIDTLQADVGNSQKFAITPETTNVENVVIRAQASAVDSKDNNLTNKAVQIDAERMVGVTKWTSEGSRADLVIEDVRILPNQITKDITVEMKETDPGQVDFGVYFNACALKATGSETSTLFLKVHNTLPNIDGYNVVAPLANTNGNPGMLYTAVAFTVNGTQAVLQLDLTAVKTYAELNTALQAGLTAGKAAGSQYADLLANVTITQVPNDLWYSDAGEQRVTDMFEVKVTNGKVTLPVGPGWSVEGKDVPANNTISGYMAPTPTNAINELVTVNVILDDVGRCNLGGDLVIGSLSTGEINHAAGGVQQFDIEVRDNSKMQTISSTNNALQVVNITSGATTNTSNYFTKTTLNEGDLTVNGTVSPLTNVALPGTALQHDSGYGFSDVRVIDASTFKGKLAFTAEITDRSIAKYINLRDQGPDAPSKDNINFVYTGGNDDDTMKIDVNAELLGSRSRVLAGREDFTFTANGGDGNDNITLSLINPINPGGAQNWYNNQDLNNNITISGGAGNDTIRTPGAGDAKLFGNAGHDTFYTDNTGFQAYTTAGATGAFSGKAVWAFNTTDQVTAGVTAARNINDLRSDFNSNSSTNVPYNLYNYNLTVTFKGVPTTVKLANTTNYKLTDLEINQGIKKAINSDATLSKLLVAEDGPANSLVVKSLIDGVMTAGDLNIALAAPAVGTLTPVEISALGTAYGIVSPTEAAVLAAMATSYGVWNTKGDYTSQLANDGAVVTFGADSTSTSDNIITPDDAGNLGNDVIVLGTTVGADAATSSNETVVYKADFGKDVIVNFDVAGFGIDHLDFTALGGLTYTGAVDGVNKSIAIAVETLANDTAAEVAALYQTTDTALGATHVYVAYNAHNVGSVYSVVDPAGVGAGTVTAKFEGTIDLADTPWGTVGTANFVNAAAPGFFLQEGPTGAVAPIVPPVPGGTIAIPVGTTGNIAATAAADMFTFNVTAAKASSVNTQVVITGALPVEKFDITMDKMTIDTVTPLGVTTLSALNGIDGISVQYDPFTTSTLVTFGPDGDGDVISLTLAGVVDATLVNITVI